MSYQEMNELLNELTNNVRVKQIATFALFVGSFVHSFISSVVTSRIQLAEHNRHHRHPRSSIGADCRTLPPSGRR